MQKYSNYIQDAAGNAISGATIAVTLNGGGVATIYSDNGVTAIVGNLSSDANGQFEFYAANGRYDLTISGTGVTTTSATDIILFDQADGHLDDIAGLSRTDSNIIVGDGTDWVAESGATARTSLGAQAQNDGLDDIAGLAPTDGNIIVGDGTNWVAESGAAARTSLGVEAETRTAPQAVTYNIASDADYTLTSGQELYGRVIITDTSVILTTARNIVCSTTERSYYFQNDTAQTLTLKTSGGSGIAVAASGKKLLSCDGTNVVEVIDVGDYADSDALSLFNASGSAPVYACRAWVNFNGTGTVAIRGSGNVSSITDNGTGDYTVNFSTSMSDANYAVNAIAQRNAAASSSFNVALYNNNYANAVDADFVRIQTSQPTSYTVEDALAVCVTIFR